MARPIVRKFLWTNSLASGKLARKSRERTRAAIEAKHSHGPRPKRPPLRREESRMGKAKVFERAFRVATKDIDGLGHVNNVVYLRYAQDAAVAHWFAAAPAELAESIVWVVRRHEIDYLSPAFEDDELVARTWVGKATAATSERVVEIWRPKDNQLLARVRSVWVPLDVETHRPQRVNESLRTYFEDESSPEAEQP
jgi:acyl-CoA thioester hydrolase